MNAIVKSTERLIELASLADAAASQAESDMRSAVQHAILAGEYLLEAKAEAGHGNWLTWLKENWRFSDKRAQQYMHLAKSNICSNLDSASSISEALRMIADAKQEERERQSALPLLDDDIDSVAIDNDFACGECDETFSRPVWHCQTCGSHWAEDVESCRKCSEDTTDVLVEYEDVDDDDDDHLKADDDLSDDGTEDRETLDPEISSIQHANESFSISQWNNLDVDERNLLFFDSNKTLNKQDNDSIEWAQWSWNPITGCKHDCPYCYARDLANRFYPQKFEPSIYPDRFRAPMNTAVPDKAETDIAFRNVFTGSMADVFGRWVPDEWIKRILGVASECTQWNFLCLTKFPQRVHEFGDVPPNVWMGTTVDCQDRVANAEKAFAKMGGGIKWLSVEPMLTPLKFNRLDMFDWVVIGGASKSSQTPAWMPPLHWMIDLYNQAKDAGCAVYFKSNCGIANAIRIREFPWQEYKTTNLPEQLKYLNIK